MSANSSRSPVSANGYPGRLAAAQYDARQTQP
jgi:hypothetical protein